MGSINDDYEDPGFQLDWTMVQMLIPSALMSTKWVEREMNNIKDPKFKGT
jgi:hypothetical protein